MGSAGDVFENFILDAMFGDDAAPNMPSTYYVALFNTQPNDSNSLAMEVPVSGTGYSRVAVPNTTEHWMPAVASQKKNASKIQFAMASGTWGECRWFGLYDAASNGNLVVWGELPAFLTPTAGNAPYFDPGALIVTCD